MLYRDFQTGHLPSGVRKTFRRILNLHQYFIQKPTTSVDPDGFFLCTNKHCAPRWNLSERTLERHLARLRDAGLIAMERRRETAQRFVKILPPTPSTRNVQLQLFEPEPHVVAMPVRNTSSTCTYASLNYIYTGTDATPVSAATGDGVAGQMAGQMAGQVAGLHVVYNVKDEGIINKITPSPFSPPPEKDGREGKFNVMNKDNYQSTDPVLKQLRTHEPFQTEEQAMAEGRHVLKVARLRHLKRLEPFNPKPLKELFRRHRKLYDKEKRQIAGDFYGFYGSHIWDYYRLLDKVGEFLIANSMEYTQKALEDWMDDFLGKVRRSQRTFTVPFLLNNFVTLIELMEVVEAKELQAEDGLVRTGYKRINNIPGVIEDLDKYQATYVKYEAMRTRAKLNLDTRTVNEWNGRALSNLLQFVDNVADEAWEWLSKQDDRRTALQQLVLRVLLQWQHYPRWSLFIFAKRWSEINAVIQERKAKKQQAGPHFSPPPKPDSVHRLGDVLKNAKRYKP